MEDKYIERQKERYRRNIKKISGTSLSQIKETAVSDIDISYFTDKLESLFVKLEDTAKTPKIGTYCAMAPEEFIYALGYLPLKLCGNHPTAAMAGEEFAPRDSCPVVKASAGFQMMNIMPMFDNLQAVLIPGSCDGKKKAAEILSNFVPTVPIPIYMSKSDDGFELLVETFYGLKLTLENITGKKITATKLKKACVDISKASMEAYKLYEFLSTDNSPISGTQVMAIMSTYAYDNPKKWASKAKKLNHALKEIKPYENKRKRPKPRIIIAGSPIGFPNFKLPYLLETLGAKVVSDESCLAGRLLYDPVVPDNDSLDGIIRALAARYVAPCTCPTFTEMEDRFYRLEQVKNNTKADGIIYHVLRGCVPFDFELAYIEKWAQKHEIPVLRVETDFGTEDYEPLKIRLEAFIEMLERR